MPLPCQGCFTFVYIYISICIRSYIEKPSNRTISDHNSSGSRGAEGAMAPPGPVKIGHKKDGR